MTPSPDCLIIGGGIAGLWTLRRLVAEGFDAALVEVDALGAGQTIASQGILHAGTKYALTGKAAGASRAAGEAAAVWASLRAGPRGFDPDLRGARDLSPATYMFTTPGVGSRLTGLAASRALASGPQRLEKSERPEVFREAPGGVDVYRLDEPVVDVPALLETLAWPVRDRLVHARSVELGEQSGESVTVSLELAQGRLQLAPKVLICAAGAGNARLLATLGLDLSMRAQRRPLHMLLARGRDLPPMYAHCVSMSDKPRATMTSAVDSRGRTVWYIGGQIAESGVERSPADQVEAGKAELACIVPWVETKSLEWATWRVDRAEGDDPGGGRPDTPVIRRQGRVIACWPTKLVLAPLAAGAARARLAEIGLRPSGASAGAGLACDAPAVATPLWEREDLRWN